MCNQLLENLVFNDEPDLLDLNGTLSDELIDLGPDIGQQLGEQSPTRDVPDLSEAECQYIERLIELNIGNLLKSNGRSIKEIYRLKPFFSTYREVKKQDCGIGQSSDSDSSDTEDSTETEDENIKELLRYNENLEKLKYSKMQLQELEPHQLRIKEHTIRKLNIEEILGPEAPDIKELLQSEENTQESKIYESKEKHKKDKESDDKLLRSDSPDIEDFLGTKDESIKELLEFKEDLTQELHEFDVQECESEKVDDELLLQKCSNIEKILETDIDNFLHCKEELSIETRKSRTHKVKFLGLYINDLVNVFLKLKIDVPRNLHNTPKDTQKSYQRNNVNSSKKNDAVKYLEKRSECVQLDGVLDFEEQSNVKQIIKDTGIVSHTEKPATEKINGSGIKKRLESKHDFIKDTLEKSITGCIDQLGPRPSSLEGTSMDNLLFQKSPDIEKLVESNIENLLELKVELDKMRNECKSEQTNIENIKTNRSKIPKLRSAYSNLKDNPKKPQSNTLSVQKSNMLDELAGTGSPCILKGLKCTSDEHPGVKYPITEVSEKFYEKFLKLKELPQTTEAKMSKSVNGHKLKHAHILVPHRTEQSKILEQRAQKYKSQYHKISQLERLESELRNIRSQGIKNTISGIQNKEEAPQKQKFKCPVITSPEFKTPKATTVVAKIRGTANKEIPTLGNHGSFMIRNHDTKINTPKLTKVKTHRIDLQEHDLDAPACKKPKMGKYERKENKVEAKSDEKVFVSNNALKNKLNLSPLIVVSIRGTLAESPIKNENIKNNTTKVSNQQSSDIDVVSRNNIHLNLNSSQYTQRILELNDSEANISNNKTLSRPDISDIEKFLKTKNHKTLSRSNIPVIDKFLKTNNHHIKPRKEDLTKSKITDPKIYAFERQEYEIETANINRLLLLKSPGIEKFMQPNIDNPLKFKNENKCIMQNDQTDNIYYKNIQYEAGDSPGKENVITENLVAPKIIKKLDLELNNEYQSESTNLINNTFKSLDLEGSNVKPPAKMFCDTFLELFEEIETIKPKIVKTKNAQKLQKANILKPKIQKQQVQKPKTKIVEVKTHEFKDTKLEFQNKLLKLEQGETACEKDLKHEFERQLPRIPKLKIQASVQQEYKIPPPRTNMITHHETKTKSHTFKNDKILKIEKSKVLDLKKPKVIDKTKENEVETNKCEKIWDNIKTYKKKQINPDQMKADITKTNCLNNNTKISGGNSKLNTKTYYENFLQLKGDLITDNLEQCKQQCEIKESIDDHLSFNNLNVKDLLITNNQNLKTTSESDRKSTQEEPIKLIGCISQETKLQEINLNELMLTDFQVLLHSKIVSNKRLSELKELTLQTERTRTLEPTLVRFKNEEKLRGTLAQKPKLFPNERQTSDKPHTTAVLQRQESKLQQARTQENKYSPLNMQNIMQTESQVIKTQDAEVFKKPVPTLAKRRRPIIQGNKTFRPKKQNGNEKSEKEIPESKKPKMQKRNKKECKTDYSTNSSSDSDESGNTDSSDDDSTSSSSSGDSSGSNDSSRSGSDTSSVLSTSDDSDSSDDSGSTGDSSDTEDKDTTSLTHPKRKICKFCDRIFNSKENLKEHRRMHSKGGHACQVCRRSFVYKYELNAHLKEHVADFVCCICGQDFQTKTLLRDHIDLSHSGRPKCMFCTMNLNKLFVISHKCKDLSKRSRNENQPLIDSNDSEPLHILGIDDVDYPNLLSNGPLSVREFDCYGADDDTISLSNIVL